MNSISKSRLFISLFILCIIFSVILPTNAITLEELAHTCEKMENAYQDITIEYEFSVEPAPTIEDLKNDGIHGSITVGSSKCTFSTKLPFNKRFVYKYSQINMDENGHSFKSTIMKSFDGKVFKELHMGGLSATTNEQVDAAIGVITDSNMFSDPDAILPLRFTILNLKYIDIDKTPLSDILQKKDFIRIVDTIEKVNGFDTIHIDILWDAPKVPILHKKEPKLRIYFATDYGYTPIRFDNLSYSESGSQVNMTVNITELEKVANNLWYPKQAYLKIPQDNIANNYKASKIIVNQGLTDKDFDIKFPEGTRITNEITGIKYVQTKYEIQSLSGKSLPDLSTFGITLEREEIKSKRILVCFWDIEQRPSRSSIIELNKKAKELREKGIFVIAIQASVIKQETLDDWAKENNLDFQVGMIKENEEQIKSNWSVQALPWLILTDKEHIVQAEGFSVTELDENLEN